ncbi:MAG TPA: hypothetical protein VMU04_22845 [Candidatus Acidoferrum sp.]|nr:hypothetical protein [Candidatus Acidoferrum sp.]
MSLETTLTDILAPLRQGQFPNEQAISRGIVLGELQELGWDICDTTQGWPVFALCHLHSKPAKQVGIRRRFRDPSLPCLLYQISAATDARRLLYG